MDNPGDTTQAFMMRVTYAGTRYHGWQIQPRCVTIQGVLESHLQVLLGEPVRVSGASRTDAGVHALGQVAHFHTRKIRDPERLRVAMNRRLPDDIAIWEMRRVPEEFHSRHDASGKHYQYRVWTAPEKPVFDAPFVYRYAIPVLNVDFLRHCAQCWIGTHDFASFASNAGRDGEDTRRTLTRIEINHRPPCLVIDVHGVSFLYKMVRALCGTLLDLHAGKCRGLDAGAILESRSRKAAGRNLPGSGLFLMSVHYPDPVFTFQSEPVVVGSYSPQQSTPGTLGA